jgi:tRNA modification GTPase
MTRESDTIFALSSGQPPAAIAVLRISGPSSLDAARAVTGRALPEARQAVLRRFADPATGETIDEGLLIWFPATQSVTGEPLVELHCHGGRAVVRDLQAVLATLPNLRSAEAGDFTRRAFANGRMDLSSIEGLGDLLAAETALQRRAAMAMMSGALSRRIEAWTGQLRRVAARIEAQLDFSDEGDVASSTMLAGLAGDCDEVAGAMEAELAKPSVDRLKDGVRVAIGGPPNAGKSTLFNHLVGRDAAIVSPLAGTTRDVIEASVAMSGIPMVIADSAGLRESGDAIERQGIDRAEALLAAADIVLWLGAPDEKPATNGVILQVHAKCDLAESVSGSELAVSAMTGEGVDNLVAALCAAARSLLPQPGDYALSQRQRGVLARAAFALREAASLEDEILVGECLRLALSALDELTGRVTTEAMLDELFSGFCIGK